MKFILVVFLSAIIAMALSEPLAYRQRSVIRTSARQTDNGGVALQAEFGDSTTPTNLAAKSDNDDEQAATEPNQPAQNGPYYPKGWRPLGQLLVLPFAVRENLDSTARNVETKSFNSNGDSEATEETATDTPTTDQQKSTEVETSEPKSKIPTAAYKKPPQKFAGQLNAANSKDAAKAGTVEAKATTDQSTTESDDEATTTEAQKEDLETTSEPESEAVDDNAEKSNVDGQTATNAQSPAAAPQFPQTAYFVQLPDGSLQRIVYLQPQAPAQAAFVPQPVAASGNLQFQQLNQSPNYPFALNPIVNPKIVTFSSQYQAF